MSVVNALPIGVGLVDELRGVLVEVAVGDGLLNALVSERVVEPQLVAEDWSPDGWIDVPDALNFRDVRQPVVGVERRAAREIRSRAWLTDAGRLAVVRCPTTVREVSKYLTTERIAAIFRHHVHAKAALA